jgi:hypothetical protein
MLSILNSRIFIPAYDSPFASDAGMNLLMPDGDRFGNWIEKTGVKIVVEWHGAIEENDGTSYPLPPNVLYDMLPHRLFIPIGTEKTMPLVKRVDIDRKIIREYCTCKKWYLPRFMEQRLERKIRLALIKQIRKSLADGKCFLRVGCY